MDVAPVNINVRLWIFMQFENKGIERFCTNEWTMELGEARAIKDERRW